MLSRWRSLAGSNADALGEELIAAYSEPGRHYHGLGHVTWLLNEAERRAGRIVDMSFVGYAIWFHDAVYNPMRGDNEEQSAAWARRALFADPRVERIARLIEMTKNHAAGDATSDEALFLDMDIAIWGAPRSAYRAYAAGVRAEYGHVPDPAFAAGRGAFLESQLSRSRLFRTDFYEDEFAALARANMSWEAGELRRSRMVDADSNRINLIGVRDREGVTARVEVALLRRLDASRWCVATQHRARLAPGDRISFGAEASNVCALTSLDARVESADEQHGIVLAFDLAGPVLDEAIAAHGTPPPPSA
jgi:predicted metal-dependent HD superfamily phosphohydrolase